MKYFLNSNLSVQRCLNPLFQHPLLLLRLLFGRYPKPQVRINKMANKQCRLLRCFFKISLKNTSFHILINSLVLYLSPECLLNFLWNLFVILEKNFQIYSIRTARKWIESEHFYPWALPQSKHSPKFSHPLQAEENYSFPQAVFFQKSISPDRRKGWRKLWFALSKVNQKIWRWRDYEYGRLPLWKL